MKTHPTKNEETVRLVVLRLVEVTGRKQMAVGTHREGFARNSSAEGISKPETRIDINMGAVYGNGCTK